MHALSRIPRPQSGFAPTAACKLNTEAGRQCDVWKAIVCASSNKTGRQRRKTKLRPGLFLQPAASVGWSRRVLGESLSLIARRCSRPAGFLLISAEVSNAPRRCVPADNSLALRTGMSVVCRYGKNGETVLPCSGKRGAVAKRETRDRLSCKIVFLMG
ncbi:hypothetical protein Chor_012212 [Crotalus horridus]